MRDRIDSLFMGPRNWRDLSAFPMVMLLLLTMRLHSIAIVKLGLPSPTYPKASEIELVLPRLPAPDRNFNRFPFCAVGTTVALRIALLLAEEHCQETRVLCGVQDSRLDMLLLIPGYS
jgi:hypothetical protein